jgi:hypothetical protein
MRLDVLQTGDMSRAAPEVHGKALIPDLLRAAPHVRGVLDRYGLRGCGGPSGPAESLEFFARAHEVPLGQLLAELRQALGRAPADPAPQDRAPRGGSADAIYRPFFRAGILVVLTFGAAWGAYLLVWISWTGSFTQAGVHEVNAHGHAQIFGWVGLFVMGFAYQAFPRFKHATLAFPWLAWASLALLLTGLVGRSLGEPLAARLAGAGAVAVASAWLEVLAIALFAGVILATWRAAGKGLAFYDYYILSALAWFVAQAVGEALYLRATLAAASREELVALVAGWQGALRDVQIHGFALLMILGVSQRVLHHFYGLSEPDRRLSAVALVCLNVAVLGEALGLCLMRGAGHAWAALWYASAWLLAGSVAALVWDWRVFGATEEADRSLKFIRAAYAWLLLSLALLLLLPAYQFAVLPWLAPEGPATALGFSHAYYGAVRHAITVGFVSLMILGVAARVVPTLNGVDVRRLTPLWAPFLLVNGGCALRVAAQTLTDFTPHAFPVTSVSGLLEVTGLALWGAHQWAVMAGRPRLRGAEARTEAPACRPGEPVTAAHRVGDVLDAHPDLLEPLLAFGFTPLANPLLRRTVARRVTVGQACRQLVLEVEEVLAALNRAAPSPAVEPPSGKACCGGCHHGEHC